MTEVYVAIGVATISAIVAIWNTVSSHKVNKFLTQHDTLWDAHNQKIDDSGKLKTLQENFTKHENKFEIFASSQTTFNTLVNTKLEKIENMITHKENGQKQVTNDLFTVLMRIEDKLESNGNTH